MLGGPIGPSRATAAKIIDSDMGDHRFRSLPITCWG